MAETAANERRLSKKEKLEELLSGNEYVPTRRILCNIPVDKQNSVAKAVYFAKIAWLAYQSEEVVKHKLKRWKLKFKKVLFFDNNETQAILLIDSSKLILSFRGTELNKTDVFTNFKFLPTSSPLFSGKVHGGYFNALMHIWDELHSHLSSSSLPIYLVGHSMGAALATIAMGILIHQRPSSSSTGADSFCVDHNLMIAKEMRDRIFGLYTFGSPMIGNKKFKNEFKEFADIIHRYVNNNDFVPRIRIPQMKHVKSKMIYIATSAELMNDSSRLFRFNDSMRGMIENQFSKEMPLSDLLNDVVQQTKAPDCCKDHLLESYSSLLLIAYHRYLYHLPFFLPRKRDLIFSSLSFSPSSSSSSSSSSSHSSFHSTSLSSLPVSSLPVLPTSSSSPSLLTSSSDS